MIELGLGATPLTEDGVYDRLLGLPSDVSREQ